MQVRSPISHRRSPINLPGLGNAVNTDRTTMPVRLPNELLDLIAQRTTRGTQAQLSVVSRRIYHVSTRVLYASILNMDLARTTRCLLTLSKKPELARLVRFFLYISYSHALGSFHALLTRALSNMTGLQSTLR